MNETIEQPSLPHARHGADCGIPDPQHSGEHLTYYAVVGLLELGVSQMDFRDWVDDREIDLANEAYPDEVSYEDGLLPLETLRGLELDDDSTAYALVTDGRVYGGPGEVYLVRAVAHQGGWYVEPDELRYVLERCLIEDSSFKSVGPEFDELMSYATRSVRNV
jgi:hypothetical protein